MIYELARDVEEIMRGLSYPVRVEYGPDRLARSSYEHRIVMQRDRRAADTVGPAHVTRSNPRRVRTRALSAEAFVFVQSALPNARINEHETECERIVDGLIAALVEWGTSTGAGDIQITEARYQTAEERDVGTEEAFPGVSYVLRFKVPRGVFRLKYTGEGKPTGTIGGFRSRTEAFQDPPIADAPASVGCDSTE